jgi:2'-5' RNA ligase
MRLFIAVEIPDDLKDQLVALKTDIPGAAWVKRPSLHLTLRFLGDGIDPIRLTPIKTALASVKAAPFTLALRGVGRFPEGNRPSRPARVLWVGITEQPALYMLQAAVERSVEGVGFPPEDRPFSAHITLARLKGEGHAQQVAQFLEKHKAYRAEPFEVNRFHLVSSLLTPQGSEYRYEASFPLTEADH